MPKTCDVKLTFFTRKQAKRFLRRRGLSKCRKVYKCRGCGQFHTTSFKAHETTALKEGLGTTGATLGKLLKENT